MKFSKNYPINQTTMVIMKFVRRCLTNNFLFYTMQY